MAAHDSCGLLMATPGARSLSQALFDFLAEQQAVREQVGPSAGLLQLTPALDRIRAEAGLQGLILDGERYDIGGEPHTYLATLNALACSSRMSMDAPAQPHVGLS